MEIGSQFIRVVKKIWWDHVCGLMCRVMVSCFLCFFGVLGYSNCNFVFALSLRDLVKVDGQSVGQWFVLLKNGTMQMVAARSSRQGEYIIVQTELKAFDEQTLLAAVVQLASGRVVSTPFHSWSAEELVLDRKSKESESDLAQLLDEARYLEDQLTKLTANRRKEAGYAIVDDLYDQLNYLSDQIEARDKALIDLKQLNPS